MALWSQACKSDTSAPSPEEIPASSPNRASVTLWLGGDVHVGTHSEGLLAPLAEHLKGFGIVNLEGPVGTGESSVDRLVNRVDALLMLRAAGVRVASVRNNHTDDLGPAGRRATAEALSDAGIAPADATGPGEPPGDLSGDLSGDRDSALLPVVQAPGAGPSVAVVAHDLSAHRKTGELGDMRAVIARTVHRARRQADIVVASFHTTGPPSYLPARELQAAVEVALAEGALVVAAHGSHALARVERRGPAIVAWGLGNLLFDCTCTKERDGLLVQATVSADKVLTARVVPIDAGLMGQPAAPAEDAALTLELLRALGSELGAESAEFASF